MLNGLTLVSLWNPSTRYIKLIQASMALWEYIGLSPEPKKLEEFVCLLC